MIPDDKKWLVLWNLPRMAEFRTRLDAENFAATLLKMRTLSDIRVIHRSDVNAENIPDHGRERERT